MDEVGPENSEHQSAKSPKKVWILVDHSAREAALLPVAHELGEAGLEVELVTITEVLSSVARKALAGGAERLLRGLRVVTNGSDKDEDLVGAIRRRQPDVLVVTEARYVRAIGVLENLTGVKSLQVGLVSDFYLDQRWQNGQIQAFVVPEPSMAKALVDGGIPAAQVDVGGPAVRPNFLKDSDREQARQDLGLTDDKPVVLVRADGFSRDRLEKLVFQCSLGADSGRYIFHHDGDGATAATLRRAADQYGLAAAMFGRVSDLEKYVAAADVVVADEHDVYVPEILHTQTATLLVGDPQREAGGAALAAQGVVDFLADLSQLGTRLEHLVTGSRRQELEDSLADWDGDQRQEKVIQALARFAENADQWRQGSPDTSTSAEDSGDEDQDEETKSSAFESIGTGTGTGSGDDTTTDDSEGASSETRERAPVSLSQAEAKEQLAQLILKERDLERQLSDLERQQERWRGRLQLARDWKEEDLAEEAQSILRGYISDAEPLEEQLVDIRRQKDKLKQAARRGSSATEGASDGGENGGDRGSELEKRFRKMEIDSDLEGLKDRIRRELGE